jgi:hypothetical protein
MWISSFDMNFGLYVNFGPEFEFWTFYNFKPPEISPAYLTNNVSGHGPVAKPMGQPHTAYK